MLILQILQGPDRGLRFELPADEPQLIGRSTEALPITDGTVSRRHAELTPDDGTWYVRDLESANGTFVNSARITQRTRLSPGDQIRCGSTLMLFGSAPSAGRDGETVHLIDGEQMDVTVEGVAAGGDGYAVRGRGRVAANQAASDHLRVIYELTRLTTSTVSRDDLLEGVLDLVFRDFRPDRGFVLLGSSPDAPLEQAAVRYRERPRTIDEGRIPVSRTIIRHALERGEGVLSTNAMNDTRFEAGDSVRDYGIRSAICVPIAAGQQIFGVIHIDSQIANFSFSESQLHLLRAIGRHAGLAMRSIELFDIRLQQERLVAVGQTVASLSHSIKNILQGLRGGADAVELAINRNDLNLAREGWPIMARNLDRILHLTLNMLAWSRPSALDIEMVDVNAIVSDAVELVSRQCDRKHTALMTDLAEDMPPAPLDAGGIHQAVVNLLMNAVEAVPARRGVVTITTQFDPESAEIRIRVGDNGPGIPAARQIELFEAFRSTKGQRGTGLGLTVTKRIVEEHGGVIELESSQGHAGEAILGGDAAVPSGTTVTITLPTDRQTPDAGDTRLPRPLSEEEIQRRLGHAEGDRGSGTSGG